MSQFLEIIEWTDDARDTITYHFPDEDREIKRGAQLIVRESQAAQFVYLGQFGDTFGPGKHQLVTDNIPILSRLRGWKYGFESPFKADVYFLATRLFTGNQWGTTNPVMVKDQDLGIVRLRAFGTYDFRVVDPRRFLKEVAGTDAHYTIDEFVGTMRSRIVSMISETLAASHLPVAEIATRYRELGEALLPLVNPVLNERYGIEMPAFVLENVSVPDEVSQAIDKRAGMSTVGNLADFMRYQAGLAIEHGGGSGLATLGAEIAAGATIAQPLAAKTMGGVAAGAAADAGLDVLTPAEAATLLRVGEADVVASLEKGDLKGTRIGTSWRIRRAALDQFLG